MKIKTITLITSVISLSLSSLVSAQNTEDKQENLTPDAVLAELMAGNERFAHNQLTKKNVTERMANTSTMSIPKSHHPLLH